MYCKECGTEITEKGEVCPNCGTELKNKKSIGKTFVKGVFYSIVILFGLMMIGAFMSGVNEGISGDATTPPSMTVEEIKSRALTIPYDDLMRNNDNYIGEIIYDRGEILQVSERRTNNYVLRVATKQSTYGYHEDIIWVNYKGNRLLEGDIIDIWGESKGLETYSAVLGNQVTIPEIDSLHVGLVTKSGDIR